MSGARKKTLDKDVINKKNNEIPKKKIRMSLSKREEKLLDKAAERDDDMSLLAIIFILVVCFAVGILLGCFLYKIAINGWLR